MVADYLHAEGYRLLARNLRLGHLELDIVAERGGVVCIVEVRTRGRGSFLPALATISWVKRSRLLFAAERLWRQTLARDPGAPRVRIDVASVVFASGAAPRVEYIEGAIAGEGAR